MEYKEIYYARIIKTEYKCICADASNLTVRSSYARFWQFWNNNNNTNTMTLGYHKALIIPANRYLHYEYCYVNNSSMFVLQFVHIAIQLIIFPR